MTQGKLFVFSSPSGAGKTTVLRELKKRLPHLVYSISGTTRAPRAGEKHGVDYFFYTPKEFEAEVARHGFIEWAQVHGNYYGTPRFFIDKMIEEGKTVLLDIDVQGKVQLDKHYRNSIGIFIEPPSFEELKKRLQMRDTESPEALRIRLENAKKETDFARHAGNYTYYIINDVLEETVRKVEKIITLNKG
ncbi:guanylate kinase [Chitinivibrio alkaliphilus]|uniref:Guanylate kinase n=1 Tax=Chitinivibrio alkaliphilus ACht1 TaxID=1313304 RepID=U7D9C6_9BACT|nr:guanylate kinase [Chitinivibrio alkaliphilus]ERP38994.1 guanylate kinase [Chitinivibrio alkaliphilus ACht1]